MKVFRDFILTWKEVKPNGHGITSGATFTPLGVLLPGQSFSFPFMFKSAKAGIFTEKWLLCTGPMLAGGRPICIVLKGIACQEDQYEKQRMEIDVSIYTHIYSFHCD